MSLHISVEEHPAAADERVVQDGLLAFNVAIIGDPGHIPLACLVRDESGAVQGGLLGFRRWRWLYVDRLWLPERLRGQRMGTRLMRAAEEWAWSHECLGIHLDTLEYQALGFYRKLGYELFGALEGYPPGWCKYLLSKTRPANV